MSTPTSPIGQPSGPVVLTGVVPGYAVIPSPTPLTFLNYYDGKFLRASDLRQEQLAMQSMIELSNQAAVTPGPSYGFDITLGSGDMLTLSPGLGTDPQGRVLYLPQSVDVPVSDLLASMQAPGGSGSATSASSGAAGSTATGATSAAFQPCDVAVSAPSATPVSGTDLYLVTLSAAEGLCGTDEVFGRLCDAACVTAADRPWRIEGVLLGLVPLTLGQLATSTSVVLTQTHLRSQVASAYYAAETAAGASLISAAGLAVGAWCLGAPPVACDAIYLGVLARSGGSTIFLDEWTARREHIETSPRRYWAFRMAMRPWNVFLAQVLQFQCQLRDVLGSAGAAGMLASPLSQAMTLLGQSATLIDQLQAAGPAGPTEAAPAAPAQPEPAAPAQPAQGGPADAAPPSASPHAGTTLEQTIADYRQEVSDILAGRALPSVHGLIDGGIIELPSAGYLPIDLTSQTALEAQVAQLLGSGVDLRFCMMRHDEAGAQFTRGQHLDRISLLAGLDDPSQVQQVDILVPDRTRPTATGTASAQPSITPALDWVLFRRRSDVDCGPPPQPLDTVTLYVTPTTSQTAQREWQALINNGGQDPQWTKASELQFDAGTASLVTPAATVQSGWNTAAQHLFGAAGSVATVTGAAYAPATSSSDSVALGRARNLVAALPPAASSSQSPLFAALTTSPEPLETGTAGALFVVAWPHTVTVGVWSMGQPGALEQEQEWAVLTGRGGKDLGGWTPAGTAVLTVETSPRIVSWVGGPAAGPMNYAGYSPGSLATGAAGVQALLNQTGESLTKPIAVVTNPPNAVAAGQDGSVFMIWLIKIQ
jgi:hypothetical protein